MIKTLLTKVLLFVALTGPSFAAEIVEAPAPTPEYLKVFPSETMEGLALPGQPVTFGFHRHIRITGDIAPGDADRLAEMLPFGDPFALSLISFDSLGGDYREGLALADVIHQRRAATLVAAGDTCLSACGLAFLGGTEELIRGVLTRPNRYVHVDAKLGFHAPFNTTYPALPTVNDQTVQFVADLFYAQAREAIRLLQSRIVQLSLNPDFVFDMLGKGTDEFLFIDRYREASQNQITVLANDLSAPRQIGATGAKLACGFLLDQAIAPAQGFSDVIVAGNWTDIADPVVLTNPRQFPTDVSVEEHGDGRATFKVATLIAGRGPFECMLTNANDGIWRGSLQGDVPQVLGRMGFQTDVTRNAAFALNDFAVLGSYLPWSALGTEDLIITGPEDALYPQVPAELRQTDGPSFDCNGTLDPAAEVICRFPRLARADSTMVKVYVAQRNAGIQGLRDSQRAWLRERDALCRPQWASLDNPVEETLTGYCLLESTLSRIDALLRL